MTVRFGNRRIFFYVAVFLLSATVLGLAAHFANVFLPTLHKDFSIFSLVVSALTIFVFLITLQWAQPLTEAIAYFILWALWLAMGAWATDIIGNTQCDGLAGQRTATKSGDMSAQAFCYEMKVIQAFSWMLFVLFTLAFIILLTLVDQAQRYGRRDIWEEPIRELPWFGEAPGYYNTTPGQSAPYPTYPQYPYPMSSAGNGQVIQTPGHSIIIQPGTHGQPPTITQVPLASA
ncbi:hypothetical protein BD779DRAFT_1667507 [Infundibulicybe gibba]|nr:hypothetical protein BD779DRAFT_1667507 [Infundibulicybe gibba]